METRRAHVNVSIYNASSKTLYVLLKHYAKFESREGTMWESGRLEVDSVGTDVPEPSVLPREMDKTTEECAF